MPSFARLTVLALALLAAAPCARADTTIERLAGPGSVTALRGWLAWTREDPTRGTWTVVVRAPGQTPRALPIAPLTRVADVDLGTDAKGRVALVLTRCTQDEGTCDLRMVSLPGGVERPIRNASRPGTDERTPTLWHGRLAFNRVSPNDSPRLLERMLSWPAKRPSRSLPALPAKKLHPRVDGLDLGAAGLAVNVHFDDPHEGICGQEQIELVALRSGHTRVLRHSVCGLSGQTFAGPAVSGGDVGWAMFCPGDEGGCLARGGALRLHLRSGRVQRIKRPPSRWVTSFALDGARAYLVEQTSAGAPCDGEGEPGPRDCTLVALDAGAWRPAQ